MRPSKRLIPIFAGAAVLLNFDAAFGCSKASPGRSMKSDLRNLAATQQSFFERNNRFAPTVAQLDDYRTSQGVGPIIIRLTPAGYTARATHSEVTGACLLYIGQRPADVPGAVAEGEPWCTELGSLPMTSEERVVLSSELFILALIPVTWLFLRQPGRRNWPVIGLVALLIAFEMITSYDLANCRDPFIAGVAIVAAAVALFALALRNRIMLKRA